MPHPLRRVADVVLLVRGFATRTNPPIITVSLPRISTRCSETVAW
jgi:hypothetical protein